MITRAQVVEASETWVGTPYHHQARLKKVGVDCIGLIIGVGKELLVLPQEFDVKAYPREPDGKSLLPLADKYMERINTNRPTVPGDVIVIAFEKDPQHFGILYQYSQNNLGIIHASGDHGRVIKTRLLFSTSLRFVAMYKFPGIT